MNTNIEDLRAAVNQLPFGARHVQVLPSQLTSLLDDLEEMQIKLLEVPVMEAKVQLAEARLAEERNRSARLTAQLQKAWAK